MNGINGNSLIVVYGSNNTPIAAMKTNDITVDCELVQIASPTTGQWKQYITGRKEATVSVGYLVGTSSAIGNAQPALRDLLLVGNSYTLKFMPRGQVSSGVSGTFILKTCKVTATRGYLVQGSFQFVLSGALS